MANERRSTVPNRAGGIPSDYETDYGEHSSNKVRNPTVEGPMTMKQGTGSFVKSDGINKPIPRTNNTRAPGQWGTS